MNAMRGTRYLSACLQTVSDCGCTPATASKIATAPSSTRSERSTSTVKSTWPGVSMILMRYFLSKRVQEAVVAADVIVISRSRSCSIQSITFVYFADLVSHSGIEKNALGRRGFSRVNVRHKPDVPGLIELYQTWHGPVGFVLPAIVRESFVRFRHAVHILLFLHCSTAAVRRVHNFFRQL